MRIKETMLALAVAALASAALPALAAANPHISSSNAKFTVHGGTFAWTTTGETELHCEEVEGAGQFTSSETGNIELTFKECTGPLGVNCTTSGKEKGEVTTTELPFHLKTVEHEGVTSPGVLITPNNPNEEGTGHFASFKCSFLASIVWSGTGLIGTITKPGYNEASSEATVVFQRSKPGHQTHTEVIDNPGFVYDLESSINGGAAETTSFDTELTLTFEEEVEFTE